MITIYIPFFFEVTQNALRGCMVNLQKPLDRLYYFLQISKPMYSCIMLILNVFLYSVNTQCIPVLC